MSNARGDNFTLPAGLSEADLLDALEGAPMLADRRAMVDAAIRADARLAATMNSMRADRATMATLDSRVRAPEGLLSMVEARLEREALAALAAPAAAEAGTLRVSAMTFERPSPFRALLESLLVRRLALAASLLLAIGLGVWGIVSGIRNWPHAGPGSGANLAQNPVPAPTITPDPSPIDDATGIARATPGQIDAATIALLAPTSPLDGPGIAADGTVYDAPALAGLAREGRLAIVVSGAADSTAWSRARVLNDSDLAGAFSPISAALAREAALPRDQWAIGSQNPWQALAPRAAEPRRRVVGVWTAASVEGVQSLLAATGASESGQSVRVLVLDEPVRVDLPTDAPSVLWWSAAPNKWDRGTIVPVIIEE